MTNSKTNATPSSKTNATPNSKTNAMIKWVKNNMFICIVILIYVFLMAIAPKISLHGIKNSGYYIKEMFMIMPVIFVLTALLDTWIPKETIMKVLGKESKRKGVIFSFILGSVSAGPIYAAFPLCGMLLNKGASIRNIVIILSSWAVVKIPMLLNEAKFLGTKFMALRWLLTISAILIFSWVMAQIIKEDDMVVQRRDNKKGLYINRDACMGCSICSKLYSEVFNMENKKASVIHQIEMDYEKLKHAIKSCPVSAIEYHD